MNNDALISPNSIFIFLSYNKISAPSVGESAGISWYLPVDWIPVGGNGDTSLFVENSLSLWTLASLFEALPL